jgi:phospho-N-acetylmuramoyl-pentapeptide-transferase
VGRYITFRAIIGLLSALGISFLFSPWFIRKLRSKQLGQVIREDGPKSHFSKSGTPTMGGGLIIFAVVIPSLLWMNWQNIYLWLTLGVFSAFALIGFYDDYLKISKKNTKGVSGKTKLFWQTMVATVACVVHFFYTNQNGDVTLPFFKTTFLPLGYFYVPFSVFVIVGASNAVNLTDGLDGLAIGPVMIAAFCYTLLTYISGHSVIASYLNLPYTPGVGELSVFSACLIGAGMGFLWYNAYPAQVFMGDVGSLPLGGALGALAVFSRHEILLTVIGGIFVLEALSVMTQVASYKLTGKRIFRMAPIHHHFELKGWPEPKVIVRFWIISVVLALVGLLSLKIR